MRNSPIAFKVLDAFEQALQADDAIRETRADMGSEALRAQAAPLATRIYLRKRCAVGASASVPSCGMVLFGVAPGLAQVTRRARGTGTTLWRRCVRGAALQPNPQQARNRRSHARPRSTEIKQYAPKKQRADIRQAFTIARSVGVITNRQRCWRAPRRRNCVRISSNPRSGHQFNAVSAGRSD